MVLKRRFRVALKRVLTKIRITYRDGRRRTDLTGEAKTYKNHPAILTCFDFPASKTEVTILDTAKVVIKVALIGINSNFWKG